MSCFSLFALAVYFHISYFLYFHIQLFQIYLSGAEMEQRVIWDLAFPQEGRFIYITRLSGPTNLLTEKYLKEYEDVIFVFAIGHILYTPTLPNISVTPISQDHYHSINAIYQDNSHTHEHHCSFLFVCWKPFLKMLSMNENNFV